MTTETKNVLIDRLLEEVRSKSQAELQTEMLEIAFRRFGARWLGTSHPRPEAANSHGRKYDTEST
jgi:hypothetical protein